MLTVLYTRPAAAVWYILFTKRRSLAHYLGIQVKRMCGQLLRRERVLTHAEVRAL